MFLINQCFQKDAFPDCLKRTKTNRIFKSVDRSNLGIYISISLLSGFSRITQTIFL